MHYTELTTDQSNEIHFPSFWCYFDPHENTTRMSNDLRVIKKTKTTTPVTIATEKASLEKINRRVGRRYSQWLDTRKLRKWCLKILEVILEGEEKAYKFQKQQEEEAAEVERWEKEQSEERQRKLQEKYQRLKQDREQQRTQKQKQQKKKQLQDDDDDDTVITEIT